MQKKLAVISYFIQAYSVMKPKIPWRFIIIKDFAYL